ncbi:MAG: hypothetical protein LBV16_07875 [Elusimicrobiota bacterium]|jgi:hypothetical protein|nr:hypothetical protein [Elusimicrobiota bacterium]
MKYLSLRQYAGSTPLHSPFKSSLLPNVLVENPFSNSSFPNASIGNPLLADNHCHSIALRLNLDSRQRRSGMTARGKTASLFVGLGFVIAYMTNVYVVNCGLVCVVAGLTRNLRRFLFSIILNRLLNSIIAEKSVIPERFCWERESAFAIVFLTWIPITTFGNDGQNVFTIFSSRLTTIFLTN